MKDEKWDKLLTRTSIDPADTTQDDVYLDDENWEKLYKDFLKVFRAMDSNRDAIKDIKGAEDYLNLVYGSGRMFRPFRMKADAAVEITTLLSFLEHPAIKSSFSAYFASQAGIKDLNDFISKIRKGKHNTDSELRDQLKSLSTNIGYYKREFLNPNSDNYIDDANGGDVAKNILRAINFDKIADGFDPAKEFKSPQAQADLTARIDEFKLLYTELLRPLVSNKDLREAFSSNGGGKIVKQINKALDKTNYSDENGPDYVAPSEKDTLTPLQELKKKINNTAEDTILKLKNRALRDKYLIPDISKPIAVAIYGANWNPKDGLAKFLEKSKDIEKKFKGKMPKAAEGFKFLVEVLNYAKDRTPRAFEGALRNGGQGLALDVLIAEYGLRNGKSDELISSAHEVLSKLRWGYMTSVRREILVKNPLNLMGDKGLSWNKTQGMQIVTKAFDATLNWGIRRTSDLVDVGENSIRRLGQYYKLNSKEQDRINKQNAGIDSKIAGQNNIRTQIDAERTDLRNQRQPHLAELTRLKNAGFNKIRRNQATTDIENSDIRIDGLEQRKTPFEQNIDVLNENKQHLQQQKQPLVQANAQLQQEIAMLHMQLNAANTAGDTTAAAHSQAMISQFNTMLNQNNNNIAAIDTQIQNTDNSIARETAQITTLDNQINNERNTIAPIKQNAQDFDSALSALKEINETIGGMTTSIKKIDEGVDKMENKEKKRFLNLMATRNLMNGQGGYVKNRNLASLVFESQKKIQGRFAADRGQINQAYINQYWANQNVTLSA